MIKQSTGEDWDNASISLSTAQPDVGGSPPSLGVHHIGFMRSHYVTTSYKTRGRVSMNLALSSRDYSSDEDEYEMQNCGFTGLEGLEEKAEELNELSNVYQKKAHRMRKSKASGFRGSVESLEVEVSKVMMNCFASSCTCFYTCFNYH